MSAKRALIVDDSRSARTFLTRILERYDLQVDGAGSAEEAIEYLAAKHPDVIFMDHLMPGMDGFQALSAIKSDPRTAAIPVMMYTSQEGDLYLNQALALGAMGVLPKQTRAADVSRALEQLRILEGRPPEAAAAAAGTATLVVGAAAPAAAAAPGHTTPVGGLTPEMRAQLDALLRDHGIEMRRFVTQTLEQQAGRIISEVRALMDDTTGADSMPVPSKPAMPLPQARAGRAALWLSAAAAAIAVLAGLFWYRATHDEARLTARLAATAARATLTSVTAAPVSAPTHDAALLVEAVPFGEPPLAGARVESVHSLLDQLTAQGFHGVVEISSYSGRFCMQGSATAWVLPAADVGYSQCAQVGYPVDFSDLAGRESPAFASMLAVQSSRGRGSIDVQLVSGAADEVATPYPAISAPLTAGEWNRAAAVNSRVEVHTRPLP